MMACCSPSQLAELYVGALAQNKSFRILRQAAIKQIS